MTLQSSFNFDPTGQQLAEIGIAAAVDHANRKHPGWSDTVFDRLVEYCKEMGSGHLFMAEDFREWCTGKVPEHNVKRAFGGIFRSKRAKELLEWAGRDSVKNPDAQGAIANKWRVK